jgi:hypothetical protein
MVVVLIGGGTSTHAAGDTIEVTRVDLVRSVTEPVLLLSADFYLPLPTHIRDVLELGVAVHFVAEFTLTKPRWYWRDRTLVRESQQYRLSYHPITRRYRVTQLGYPQEFQTLDQAVAWLSRIRGWAVTAADRIEAGETYEGAVRLRLDSDRLPGPMRIDLLTNQDWNIKAPWKRFPVTTETVKNGP